MTCDVCGSGAEEQLVTHTIQFGDKLVVVEHVPARVCVQCGERFYSPETVERLQKDSMGTTVSFTGTTNAYL
jgi:YgiT-type zinc finger domain-containing protein